MHGGGDGDWLLSQAATQLGGGDGDDVMVSRGGSGTSFYGGPGEDVIFGGTGDDFLTGGDDDDLLMGSAGNDFATDLVPVEDSYLDDDYVAQVTTDADGEWTMRVPAAIFMVGTTADGFLGEMYHDTTWLPDMDGLPVWKVRNGEIDVQLADDPDWEPEPEDPADPVLGEPGEVLARYTYDAAGNRMTATTAAGTTRYTWDSSSGLARLATVRGPDQDQTVIWGPTGPLSVREPGEDPVFLHTDVIGSVTAVTDVEGEVVGRGAYDPFGELRWTDGGDGPLVDGSTLFGFAGEQYDVETGLYYLRARYYDPAWGRFTRPDPLGPAPGAGHESTYLYAGGSPLSFVDPTGLIKARREAAIAMEEAARKAEEGLTLSDIAHIGLAGLGMIPIYGEFFDLADAGLYVVRAGPGRPCSRSPRPSPASAA